MIPLEKTRYLFRRLSKYLNVNAIFKALNDPTRRAILDLLRLEDMTAGAIADQFDMTKPSISHHLDILKQADLVTADRRGQFIYYAINTTVLEDVIQWIISFKK